MPYDARSVANYFLDRAGKSQLVLTPMSLLKILYFSHAWHLAKYGSSLVGQPFEAWKHGPVNRVVYDQVKRAGKAGIEFRLTKINIYEGRPTVASYSFPPETRRFLDNVFDYYSKFTAFTLSDLTHEADSPWDRIWSESEEKAVPGMIIPDELIRDWFERIGARSYSGGEQGVNT